MAADGYRVRSHRFFDTDILVLGKVDKKDFLEKMRDKNKRRSRAKLIIETVGKIQQRGVGRCIERGNFIKMLEPGIGLAEVRVAHKVIRVMACVCSYEEASHVVLLFDFDGHQGSDRIPEHLLTRARKLAAIARNCIDGDD